MVGRHRQLHIVVAEFQRELAIAQVLLVLPAMRRAGRGRIVNVSSLAGRVTAQGGGVYHMTKFAVEALADALRNVLPSGRALKDDTTHSSPMTQTHHR